MGFRARRRKANDPLHDAASRALKLADDGRELAGKIRELEHFIAEAPSRVARSELDRLETIPPPEAPRQVSYRHPVTGLAEAPRLSRAQAAILRSQRFRNMMVFVTAAGLVALFAIWLSAHL